jgi:dienelactone hydrolase
MARVRAYFKNLPQYDSIFSIVGLIGIWLISLPLFIVIALGMPTGIGLYFDIPFVCLTGTALHVCINLICASLLGLIRMNFPRLLMGSLFGAFALNSIALNHSNISYWATAIVTFVQLMLGFSITTSIYMLLTARYRQLRNYSYIGGCLLLIILCCLWLFDKVPFRYSEYEKAQLANEVMNAIQANNPSDVGPYPYTAITYGNGADRYRKEFGGDVNLFSTSVDGSHLIERWPLLRKLFWGYDESQLALNGRVWLPEGEGPFPVVFIVHGNHLMEDFSDEGYAYIGELLASKGYITISVDENFINYSVWSGGLSNDMELRSWVLLQHIEQIREFSRLTNNPLSSKVDMSRIALIGHSRGGQAVVRAAANVNIHDDVRAIIAIAPTDFTMDDQYITNDINYLVIQGAQDGDVSTFSGDRQYERTTVANKEFAFKSSLYIEGANHGQFNTNWGSMDLSLPTGLFLSNTPIMDGLDQRRIAKTYIAAFLESAFQGTTAYIPMFKDYRQALAWLPPVTYRNRFESNDFVRISDFEEDHNTVTTSITGGKIKAVDLDIWEDVMVKDRQDNSKHNRSVQLQWSKPTAAFEILLPEREFVKQLTSDNMLTFSIANLTARSDLDLTIELETTNGIKRAKSLSEFYRILPAIQTHFTKERFLDIAVRDGRYGASTEPVFQTMMIPLDELIDAQAEVDNSTLHAIRFRFNNVQEGHILVDDIGFY